RNFLEIGPKKSLFFFTKDILKKHKDIEVNYTLSPKAPEGEHIQKIFEQFNILLDYDTPNPSINWITSPYYVNTEPISWPSPETGIRRAGVSAFGFGGTNYHVILEEFIPQLYGTTSLESQKDIKSDDVVDSIPFTSTPSP
ncbi:unnamed protein product, partial [marine sediment metagenome]